MSRRRIALLVGVVALLSPSVAHASMHSDALKIRRGLTQAQRAHWLQPADTERYRAALGRAGLDTARLPKARVAVIASLLNEVAFQGGSYTSPRALALFSMLETNLAYLETHVLPRGQTDITDVDGVVYRWFAGRGFQFHPLANFGALNTAVASEDVDATRTLADALVARGVPRGPSLRWEYYFPFDNGRPPWTSGMAQAVAAQALSGAASLLNDQTLLQAAGKAYAAVPAALVQKLAEGPWIRLYSFNRLIVLNAQLQAILSLLDFAQATGDADAQALASAMTVAAQILLPSFDTGYWSLYSLGGAEAPLNYQRFVTQLLIKLASRTQDPVWKAAAARFYGYVRQPPQIGLAPITAPIPVAAEGATGLPASIRIAFTLSKRSRVTLTAGGRSVTATLSRGPRTLIWKPGPLKPGSYNATLTAVDLAGNRATVALPQPFVVTSEAPPPATVAPQIASAQLQGGVLTWQVTEPGASSVELELDLASDSADPQALPLGQQPLSGSLTVTLPSGTWEATLVAVNQAGLSGSYSLGTVVVP